MTLSFPQENVSAIIRQCQLFFTRDQMREREREREREISLCYSVISVLPAIPSL